MLEDKFKLTKDQNRLFARSNLTHLVYITSRFEGINATLSQTQMIIDGLGVDDVPIDDINIIVQLKQGWQYVINFDEKLDLDFFKNVNRIVALNESLAPGELRTGEGGVDTELGEYKPSMVNGEAEAGYLSELLANKNSSITDKWPEWNNLIAKYYMTNDMSKLKHWTYENGIQGIQSYI